MDAWSRGALALWCVACATWAGGCERGDAPDTPDQGTTAAQEGKPKGELGLLEVRDDDAPFVRAPRAMDPLERGAAIRAQLRTRASEKNLGALAPGYPGETPPRTAHALAQTLSLPGPALSDDPPTSDLELTILFVALARRAGLSARAYTQPEAQIAGTHRGLIVGGYVANKKTHWAPMVRERVSDLVELEQLTDVELEGLHLAESAMALLEHNASAQAQELAERAVELAPERGYAWVALARTHERRGRAADAMRALDKGLEVRGTRAMRAMRADLLTGAGRAREALALAEAGLATHPDDPALLAALARAACAQGDGARAANAYEASATQGDRWESWRDAAIVAASQGEPVRAREAVRKGRLLREEPALWDALDTASEAPREKWVMKVKLRAQALGACALEGPREK